MSSRSKNALCDRKNLEGYVVISPSSFISLALNYGPTINGKGWGFNWIGRATVFKTKKQALETLRKQNIGVNYRVVPLKTVAVLIPHISKKFKVYYRAEARDNLRSIQSRVLEMNKQAEELLEKAEVSLTEAWSLRRRANILEGIARKMPKKVKK